MHPVADVDLADPALVADPYPAFRRLRTTAPVGWYAPLGLWLVSRHADVDAVLRDRRFVRAFTPLEPRDVLASWNALNTDGLLEKEPPEHTRLRGLVSRAFTPRRVEALRPRVRQLAGALLDQVPAGPVDVVGSLAEQLPVEVIAELLGVPVTDRPSLRPWSRDIVALYEPVHGPQEVAAAARAAEEFTAYLTGLVAQRRRAPGDDLLSALVAVGDALTPGELVATAVLLLNAGHEATVNALGTGLLGLLTTPGAWQALREDRALVAPAVEELLRWDPPLQLFQRTATEDVVLSGVRVRRGERVGLLLGAANRDEEVFADPDVVRLDRAENPHVSFGAGTHFCLGAGLARLELQEALSELLDRFPAPEIDGEPVRRAAFQFRGLVQLRLRG